MIITALIGYPTDHSISPYLFNYFASKYNLEYSHVKFNVYPDYNNSNLKKAVEGIRALNIKGANITLPYKKDIMKYLDKIHPDAKRIGAVNTIINKNGCLEGYNTDWYGAIKSIEKGLKRKIDKSDQVVIFGTGGASRAVIYGLLKYTNKVTVVYRVPLSKRTESLLIDYKKKVRFLNYNDNIEESINQGSIICNTTSEGMIPNINKSVLNAKILENCAKKSNFSKKLFFDVVFNPYKTVFLKNAELYGAKIQTGITMMVYQGKVAFELWTGKRVSQKSLKYIEAKLSKLLKKCDYNY